MFSLPFSPDDSTHVQDHYTLLERQIIIEVRYGLLLMPHHSFFSKRFFSDHEKGGSECSHVGLAWLEIHGSASHIFRNYLKWSPIMVIWFDASYMQCLNWLLFSCRQMTKGQMPRYLRSTPEKPPFWTCPSSPHCTIPVFTTTENLT